MTLTFLKARRIIHGLVCGDNAEESGCQLDDIKSNNPENDVPEGSRTEARAPSTKAKSK